MKVLHVCYSAYPDVTGASIRSRYLAEAQRGLGVEPVVVSSPFQPPANPAEARGTELVSGIPYHRTFDPRYDHRFMVPKKSLATRLNKLTALLPFARTVAQLAQRERANVVHGHSLFFCGMAAVLAGRRAGIPSIYEVRSLIEDTLVQEGGASSRGVVYQAYRQLDTLTCRLASHVTTISQGLKRDLIERGIPAERITVVGNGVDVATQTPVGPADPRLRAELGFPDDAFVVGYIGTLFEYEGLDLLVDAVGALLPGLPNLRLLIVGGGNAQARLVERARERGLGDRARFVARVPHDEVGRYYALVDLFVLPRRSTRLTDLVTPLKPLEIMARAKAVLASDCGGHRELLDDGENGLLFEAGSERALAERIQVLQRDRDGLDQLGRRARQWVEAHRTWDRAARTSVELYGTLVQRRGGDAAAETRAA